MSISPVSLLSSTGSALSGRYCRRSITALKSTAIALLLIVLHACGGGGGGSDTPAPQPFTFAQAGPIDLYVRDTYTNTANGPGADGVSYTSSNTQIATVDGITGQVTAIGVGTANITANKLVNVPNSDAKLVANHAVYQINVRPSGPEFSARAYHTVTPFNNRLWLIGGNDSKELKNDVWSSVDGITWTQEIAQAAFSARAGHQVVAFNNQLWLIGGSDGTNKNDVWSSSDGVAWTQVATVGPIFSPRRFHQVVVYNNKMFLIGGFDNTQPLGQQAKNDVWSSTDGISWTEETPSAAFSARSSHQVVIYNGQLWLIGGFQGSDQSGNNGASKNDVWSSTDGIVWTPQTAQADFHPRSAHQALAYNGQLWLIGGFFGDDGSTTEYNDVWSSSDGITWTQQTASASFSGRDGHQVVVNDNKLLLLGGLSAKSDGSLVYQNDAWISSDGINWLVLYRGVFQSP